MMQEGDVENHMTNSMDMSLSRQGSLKQSGVLDDSTYDELDQERDEVGMDSEGIDDMENLEDYLKDVQATVREQGGGDADKSRIKTLEKSLEDEKRRLAGMEMQLREAKRQRDAENKMTVVTKQSKMLETMMNALSTAAQKEMSDRSNWESEWRQRFSDFHGQHREMEDALKRKHVQELKAVKDEIQVCICFTCAESNKKSQDLVFTNRAFYKTPGKAAGGVGRGTLAPGIFCRTLSPPRGAPTCRGPETSKSVC